MTRQPEPTPDQWYEMRARGKEVASIARYAKKWGGSVNLKAKVVSYLRIALNEGIDLQKRDGGVALEVSKASITAWANFAAGEVMLDTARDRRENRMSDFGYAVANAQKSAFKKGWSLAAGRAELPGAGAVPRSSAEVLADVPTRYRGIFDGIMGWTVRRGGNYYFQSISNFAGVRWVPVQTVPVPGMEGKITFESVQDESYRLSDGAVQALAKAGLLERLNLGQSSLVIVACSAKAVSIWKEYDRLRKIEIERRVRKRAQIRSERDFDTGW